VLRCDMSQSSMGSG